MNVCNSYKKSKNMKDLMSQKELVLINQINQKSV